MGVDQEAIRKRFSQLEMDINNINKMIDDNLQIGEQETDGDAVVSPEAPAETVEEPQTPAASGSDREGDMAPEQQPAEHEDKSATDHVIDHSTDTSEDFTAGNVTTGISSASSVSSPGRPETPIFIPKNGAAKAAPRRPTNPFRVVSIGTPHTDAGARKPSGEPATDSDSISKLQKRLDYLTKKCIKLQKEINYLNDMNRKNTLSIEDKRKLASAIDKLQEYLDRKTKEKYDLGVLVSRQLRKEIDRGENGQFWIGTK